MVMGPSGNGHGRKMKGKQTRIYHTNTLSASFTDLPFSMCYFPASAASKAQTLQKQPLLQTKGDQMEQGYPNVVSRQNCSVPGPVMYHLNDPNCQDWGSAVLTPPMPMTCSPQLPSGPCAQALSSCLGMGREVRVLEGEKGHWGREGMRKVSWRRQSEIT